jgi:hypothetical protein
MTEATYDVFKGLPDKNPLWLGAVPGLQRAIDQMKRMSARLPGDYFVFDPRENEVVATVHQHLAVPITSGSQHQSEEKAS